MSTVELQAGLDRMKDVALHGALAGLQASAAGVTLDMRNTTAHGDVTGATRANYTAYAVGMGETGGDIAAHSISAVEALNPGHVATSTVAVDGLGVIVTSFTDYQKELETENAGEKAVLGPTIAASGQRFTQGAARGSREALR